MPITPHRLACAGRALALLVLLLGAGCHPARRVTRAGRYPAPGDAPPNLSAWTQGHYPARIAEFRRAPLRRGDIVFLGNSITEQGGDWGRRFGLPTVRNRGISGDVTAGVLRRLGEIGYYRPKAVFLLIGINDLFQPGLVPEESVAANIAAIVRTLHTASPGTRLYVQTILPTTNAQMVARISRTNALLRSQADPGACTLLDLHVAFADDHDLLRPELTTDGLHLTEAGYQLWVDTIRRYVR